MLVNTDNGSNIKKGVRELSEQQLSIREQPLVLFEEEEEIDDWTSYTPNQFLDSDETDSSSSPLDPMFSYISVEDVFHPCALEEEQNWVDGNYEDVTVMIQSLEDEFAQLIDNPRTTALTRIPCFCHLLQVEEVYPSPRRFILYLPLYIISVACAQMSQGSGKCFLQDSRVSRKALGQVW